MRLLSSRLDREDSPFGVLIIYALMSFISADAYQSFALSMLSKPMMAKRLTGTVKLRG